MSTTESVSPSAYTSKVLLTMKQNSLLSFNLFYYKTFLCVGPCVFGDVGEGLSVAVKTTVCNHTPEIWIFRKLVKTAVGSTHSVGVE